MIDLKKLKAGLEAKLKELEERAEEIEEDLSAKPDSDRDENAIESEDDEVLASLGDLTLDDIRSIKLALNRINSGNYGECTTCGTKIAEDRLKVLPHATTCIRCA